jgi:threonylcarbamoyladenosine tRNA methylthiotransferase MtaB
LVFQGKPRLDVSYLHVFTYSEREQTLAAELPGVIPGSTRADRSKMLHILSDKKRRAFYNSQLGTVGEVLFEDDQKNGYMHGFTKNYVKVRAKYDPVMVNELKTVQLLSMNADGEVEVAETAAVLYH